MLARSDMPRFRRPLAAGFSHGRYPAAAHHPCDATQIRSATVDSDHGPRATTSCALSSRETILNVSPREGLTSVSPRTHKITPLAAHEVNSGTLCDASSTWNVFVPCVPIPLLFSYCTSKKFVISRRTCSGTSRRELMWLNLQHKIQWFLAAAQTSG